MSKSGTHLVNPHLVNGFPMSSNLEKEDENNKSILDIFLTKFSNLSSNKDIAALITASLLAIPFATLLHCDSTCEKIK